MFCYNIMIFGYKLNEQQKKENQEKNDQLVYASHKTNEKVLSLF